MAISFKNFVSGICEAVASASEKLSNREQQLLDTFFTKEIQEDGTAASDKYVPKTVFLEAPVTNQDGSISKGDIEIPLISLVSHSPSKMKKFDLKIDIQAFVENEELKIELANDKQRHSDLGKGTLEITISPDESPEGLKELIESYENVIKNQIQ
jgi:hypothetical protein